MAEKATTSTPAPTRVRKWMRLLPDTVQRVDYWRQKSGLSEQEYYALAVEEKIARENGDYDLPALEILRLNQLIDETRALSTNSANLEAVVTSGFASLLGMTRGDSYLLDDEDGELGAPDPVASAIGE
jgi:hypothetical protein